MLANEFLAFEHSPLFFVDIIIHCSLLRTCRVRVEEKEEFLVYTVLWTLTCHPYLESATALSDIINYAFGKFKSKRNKNKNKRSEKLIELQVWIEMISIIQKWLH